jgi:rhodanese-related sulfurtransferase
MIMDVRQPLLLVCDAGSEQEAITRLSRVGFDNVLGHLEGGISTWAEAGMELDTVNRITPEEFAKRFKAGESKVIDVRKESEYAAEHVEDAYSWPLAYINDWVKDVNPSEHFFLHCAGGYRSMIAASILESRGYRNFTEVEGGFVAISKETDVPRTDFICQSKVRP